MRRFALVVTFLLFAAACGDSVAADPVVASVEGQEIHRSDVTALRSTPDDLVVLDSEEFRQELMYLVSQRAVEAALEEDFGLSVDDADVAAAVDEQLVAAGLTIDQAVAALQDPAATEARLRALVRSQLLRNTAIDALATTDEFLDDVLANRSDLVTQVCVRHVLVETDVLAAAVVARLKDGFDFGAVAAEVSLDTSAPDGSLGCSSPARFVEAFADATLTAPVGEIYGPFETDFGWHVIIVDSRLIPTRQELEANPADYLPEALMTSEFTVWYNSRLKATTITVLPEVGVWFPEGPGILPPSSASDGAEG